MNDREKIAQILRWADDREAFFRDCLKIRLKQGGLANFQPRQIQTDTNSAIRTNRRVKITKARQLGITTGALADRFHDTLFNPYTKTALAAQHSSTASEIFLIVSTMYEFLPSWFKAIKLFKAVKDNTNALHLRNGSIIKVGTANTEFWRGQTFQHAHLTEAAYYDNLKSVLGSLAQAVSDTGTITFETSAHGHNQWHDFWNDRHNGYKPIFHSWLEDPDYVHDRLPDKLTDIEIEYIERFNLPAPRAAWFVRTLREKCGSDLNLFNQEMPITAGIAFIATGSRYFPIVYEVGQEVVHQDGLQVHHQPVPGRRYVIGADPAAGSPNGDKSAAVVLDAESHRIMASYNARSSIPEFAEVIQILAKQYNNAMCNPELNNHGLALIQELGRRNVHLFRDSKFNGKNVYLANTFGTLITEQSRNHLLSNLLKEVAEGRITIEDRRIQAQFNTFVYGIDNKPRHDTGKNDDLIFALAHALYAAPFVSGAEQPYSPPEGPQTVREKLEWELSSGKLYEDDLTDAFD